jgi:hypothetical protein
MFLILLFHFLVVLYKHKKHLHEILTQKEEPNKRIFVNRDKNACKNILYLGKYYLTNQSRPNEFKPEEKVKKVVKKVISKKKKKLLFNKVVN